MASTLGMSRVPTPIYSGVAIERGSNEFRWSPTQNEWASMPRPSGKRPESAQLAKGVS